MSNASEIRISPFMANHKPVSPPAKTQKPLIETSAGALVFKRTAKGVMVAMVVDSYNKWTFPKGHVRRGEGFRDAAARECAEETGITDISFIRKLGTIDIWFRDRYVFKGRLIHKFIHYYLFEAPTNARTRIPRQPGTGEQIKDVQWVPLSELQSRSAYQDLQEVVTGAVKTVKRITRSRTRV